MTFIDTEATKPTEEETKLVTAPKRSRETLFGTLLIFGIILVGVAVLAGIAWGGYQGFRLNQEQTALPSIGTLAIKAEKTDVVEEPAQESPSNPETTASSGLDEKMIAKAKGTDLKVLNGGAAKGSAGVAADVLKQAGYTRVTVGNTLRDYTGVAVYYAAGLEQEAAVVRGSLLKTYPKIEAKAAVVGNTETSQAVLTLIVGKETQP